VFIVKRPLFEGEKSVFQGALSNMKQYVCQLHRHHHGQKPVLGSPARKLVRKLLNTVQTWINGKD